MNLLEKNLATLRSVSPQLADLIAGAEPLADAEPIETRDGDWTLRIKRPDGTAATLHSKYAPRKEALKLIGEVDPKGLQGFLVMGFGLGYHLEELLERGSGEAEVVVLEKDPAVLRAAAELRDLRPVFSDRRVSWLVGLERKDVYQALRVRQEKLMSTALKILAHAPSTTLDSEYYQNARQAIRDFVMSGEVTMRTHFNLARKSVRNQMLNLPLYVGWPSLAELRELYAGRPGIVVSAGPSLQKNIDGLREAKGKAVLVCCDVVLKPLLEHGVVPDFTTIVDYQGQTKKFFETLPEAVDTRLLATPAAFSGTVSFYPGPLGFCGDALSDVLLGDVARPMGGYQGGGNVGHFAYLVCCYLGLEPIAFVGQDLAYPHNITHLGGTPIHEEWHIERNRFFTMEMREFEHIVRRKQQLLTVPDHDGNDIYTERSMYHYLRDLEVAIKGFGGRTVDCTEGGSRKEGTEIMPLADFLAECPAGEVPPPGAGAREPDRERLAEAVKVLSGRILEYLEVKSIIEQKLRTHKRLEKAMANGEPNERYLRTLTELELRVKKHKEVLLAIYALTPRAFFHAGKTDRKLRAKGSEGDEHLQAQFERDDKLVKAVMDSVELFEPLLRGARRRCETLVEGGRLEDES